MTSLFTKREEIFTFYDSRGEKIERKTEIRSDPLTNETSRIIYDPGVDFTVPDFKETAKNTSGKNCPFCPGNVAKMTPVFSEEIDVQGRIRQGKSLVFPNLFPYSKHNAVIVFSEEHYVRLEEFSINILKDAFIGAQKYIERVQDQENNTQYMSINWNYLPPSGGSILHPHLHVVLSDVPTNYQALEQRTLQEFRQNNEQGYYETLCQVEKEHKERWIGDRGSISWIHAFAPKSHNDYIAVFNGKTSIEEVTGDDWQYFAEGLKCIFDAMTEQGLASFNMVITIPDKYIDEPVHVRLIPRMTLGALSTSDINFFQALHQEPLSYKTPEQNAERARKYFNEK